MKEFIFKTTATMKEYNNEKWWVDGNIVREQYIEAETLNQALEKYRKFVYEKEYVSISDNAIKCKRAMYNDAESGPLQVGYVITGKCDFQDQSNDKWSSQYIDLWVRIITVIDTDFTEKKRCEDS